MMPRCNQFLGYEAKATSEWFYWRCQMATIRFLGACSSSSQNPRSVPMIGSALGEGSAFTGRNDFFSLHIYMYFHPAGSHSLHQPVKIKPIAKSASFRGSDSKWELFFPLGPASPRAQNRFVLERRISQ